MQNIVYEIKVKIAYLDNLVQCCVYVYKESKAVPLHALVAHGGRGGIARTHS
jgi:hypothetical protein